MPVDDRLSDLPDPLLIRILSRLRLKDAAVTFALSRRWQFLWAELPNLEYRSADEQFVRWVTRTLLIRSSGNNQLDKFLLDFWYKKCYASDVNIWIQFAVRNKVKDIDLSLNYSEEEDLYVLPQIIYSSSALTRLSARRCIMAPRRAVEWGSLTSLHLKSVELLNHDVEKILSGCPVLCELVLTACLGLTRLDVNNPSVRSLTVTDEDVESESTVEISAPYIRFMKISLEPLTREWRLTNVSSLVRADIELQIHEYDFVDDEVRRYAQELFGSLQHVEELKLGFWIIEVLSTMAEKGGWKLPLSRRRDLIIIASSYKYSIRGILFLLESSPILESLTITGEPITVALSAIDLILVIYAGD